MGLFNLFKKKEQKEEPKTVPAPAYQDPFVDVVRYLDDDSDGYADNRKNATAFLTTVLKENDDFTMSSSDIIDTYDHSDKIWKYEPIQLAFKAEEIKNDQNRKRMVISLQADGEWLPIGTLKSDFKAVNDCIASDNRKPHLYFGGGPYKRIVGSWDDESVEKFDEPHYFYFEYFKPRKEKKDEAAR